MTPQTDSTLVREAIDTIRLLAADAVEQAKSGHPGTPMEAAPIAYLLYARHLRYNPKNPDWAGRDRFILSCGHASMLLYSMLHLTGYALSLEEIRNFRQLESPAAGHPEYGDIPGVETTTGPLGQEFAVGVGMAMGGRFLAERIDPDLFDYHIYSLCSDGDLMEGVAAEAASLAGHLKLGNLISIYLDNRITIEGETSLAFSEDVGTRFRGYDWHVERVEGENLREIDEAIERAKRDPRPSLIIARTHIAIGAPTKVDTAEAHGAPLGAEELRQTKVAYGRDPEAMFHIPETVREHLLECGERGGDLEDAWRQRFERLAGRPDSALTTYLQAQGEHLPDGWNKDLPVFATEDGPLPTRKASGIVLNALAARLPLLLGGSADLGPSNNTTLKGEQSFTAYGCGRNIHFGVREHAMGAVLNGLAHTSGLIPYGGTFLIFSDYMRPPMRLAALMGVAPIYVFTHDSIGLGEDGPTHQPIEQLAGLRAIPNLTVIRPCDANETSVAWQMAISRRSGPTALILSRQGLPVLDRNKYADATHSERGGYVLAAENGDLEVILIATGSEVHPALAAREVLQGDGIGTRVVSLPSWEIFDAQDSSWKHSVLPGAALRVAVEAASPFGWERYVGLDGLIIGLDRFGASARGDLLMEHFGFTGAQLAKKVEIALSDRS